jgi:hypothetical protein
LPKGKRCGSPPAERSKAADKDAIFDRPKHPDTRRLLGAPVGAGQRAAGGAETPQSSLARFCRTVARLACHPGRSEAEGRDPRNGMRGTSISAPSDLWIPDSRCAASGMTHSSWSFATVPKAERGTAAAVRELICGKQKTIHRRCRCPVVRGLEFHLGRG